MARGPGRKRIDRIESGILGSGGNEFRLLGNVVSLSLAALAAGPVDDSTRKSPQWLSRAIFHSILSSIEPSASGRLIRRRFLMGLVSSEPHESASQQSYLPVKYSV